jgi:nudix-type nucleoside diphosphatase (YffH/AdpP family)
MEVIKHKEESLFNEFFEVHRSLLQFQRFDGTMSPEVTRYSFTKWDAVAVLVYHVSKDSYILVRQMRYPPTHHGIDPWLVEIVAGGISPGENEEAAARRELIEEVGYDAIHFERMMQFYVSPGIMSERITLFYAEVDESSRVNEGGGLLHEDEDIELIWLPKGEVLEWIAQQPVGDAKTIAALLWHLQKGSSYKLAVTSE